MYDVANLWSIWNSNKKTSNLWQDTKQFGTLEVVAKPIQLLFINKWIVDDICQLGVNPIGGFVVWFALYHSDVRSNWQNGRLK